MGDVLAPDNAAQSAILKAVADDVTDAVSLDNVAGRRTKFWRKFENAALGTFGITLAIVKKPELPVVQESARIAVVTRHTVEVLGRQVKAHGQVPVTGSLSGTATLK